MRWTWRVKLSTQIETDLMAQVREAAETEAINVFAANLKDLLLLAPAGPRPTLGLDPGLRTGVKVAVIDGTGQVVGHGAIYPHAPKNQWDRSIEQLAAWCREYKIELVAIGNGTASRETEKLVGDLGKRYPELKLARIVVSESGASIYSASEFASRELPDLDVTIRGAVSIARRVLTVYEAAMRYAAEDTPLVVIAGDAYGTGSSRDWAAKGTKLLGIRAVIAEGLERIHRSNLIGMGVLPLQFQDGVSRKTLNLDGSETFDLTGLERGIEPRMAVRLTITRTDGSTNAVDLICRLDTAVEVEYYRHGGMLHHCLRETLEAS